MLTSLDDALKIIEDVVSTIQETEICDLHKSLNRIAAFDIEAPYALPPFTNTGVDGYAFRHAGSQDKFQVIGASFAGEPFKNTLNQGQAVRIATGAVLPEGADTVVMQEVCSVEEDILYIHEIPSKGANLRLAGGDISRGEIAVKKNQILRAQDVALLTALGISQISVIRPLRIAIASTGHELLQPGQIPKPGQIVDTNSLMLAQMLESSGIHVTHLEPLPDDYKTTSEALKKAALIFDMVITTGGVSVGDRDYVRDVLHDEGKVHFWKLAIRPGKPVIFGHIDSCVMIGLPGNPVSAYVTCLLIVRAVLNALQGRGTALPNGFKVTLGEDISKPESLRAFPRAGFSEGMACPYAEQGSNLYASLTNADGLLDLPAGRSDFVKGEEVIYRPFNIFS